MNQPASRQGDPHACPLCEGLKPHVGGKITGGISKVMIGGRPAATIGASCQCQSPTVNSVTSGSTKVLIGGLSAARRGDTTAHGGAITGGCGKVRIG